MTTAHWEHNILAPARYSGTSRRPARMTAEGAIFPPPIRFGIWPPMAVGASPAAGDWVPRTDDRGRAPASYGPPYPPALQEFYGERTYVFAFWSISGSSPTGTRFFEVYDEQTPSPGGGPWTLDAKAWYVWNYGGGGPGHAIEVDAFNRTDNVFLPDFFVDVLPDGPPDARDLRAGGPLSRIANYDGYVDTDRLTNPVQIRAREIIGDGEVQYEFLRWLVVGRLSSGTPLPFVDNDRIFAHRSNIMRAFAIYNRIIPGVQPPPTPPGKVVLQPEGGYIIGIPAGQPFTLIPWTGGPPVPVGGDDRSILKRIFERIVNIEAGLHGLK